MWTKSVWATTERAWTLKDVAVCFSQLLLFNWSKSRAEQLSQRRNVWEIAYFASIFVRKQDSAAVKRQLAAAQHTRCCQNLKKCDRKTEIINQNEQSMKRVRVSEVESTSTVISTVNNIRLNLCALHRPVHQSAKRKTSDPPGFHHHVSQPA